MNDNLGTKIFDDYIKPIICYSLKIIIFVVFYFVHYYILVGLLNNFNFINNIKTANDRFVGIHDAMKLFVYFFGIYFTIFIIIYIIKRKQNNKCITFLIETNYITFIFAMSIFIYKITIGDASKVVVANKTMDFKYYYIPNLLVTLFPIIFCFTSDNILKYFYDNFLHQVLSLFVEICQCVGKCCNNKE